jgi:hypothetical protein
MNITFVIFLVAGSLVTLHSQYSSCHPRGPSGPNVVQPLWGEVQSIAGQAACGTAGKPLAKLGLAATLPVSASSNVSAGDSWNGLPGDPLAEKYH